MHGRVGEAVVTNIIHDAGWFVIVTACIYAPFGFRKWRRAVRENREEAARKVIPISREKKSRI